MEARQLLEALHVAERLKDETRHCTTTKGAPENVASHSWRMALMAYFMTDEFPELDMNKVIKMCLIHDLGECFTGDIPTFRKTQADEDREASLLSNWVRSLPDPYASDMTALYAEMDALETPEAKLYKSIDKLEAVIQHNESPISTWEPHEYELNRTYATDIVQFSSYLKELRAEILKDTNDKIAAGKYRFSVSASKIKFDGFLSVYKDDDEKSENKALIHGISEESQVSLADVKGEQHFTQPPAHFTEASLVKQLEELGIGRPSTYAPTITTIIARHYVAKEQKNLYITELGEVVNNIMKKSFASIVDVNFTAYMEGLLDRVEDGSVKWKTVVRNFYPDLHEAVEQAQKELEQVKIEDEVTDVICEECGRNMVVKYGPHGKFLACPGFPDCRNTKPYYEKIGVMCPKCGDDIVIKKTKKGRRYYGCINNPECDFMSWQKPSEKKCPKCGGAMVEKGNKIVCMDEQCGYVEAKEKK